MKDVFGTAILDYQQGNYTEDLVTSTSISEEDVLPLPHRLLPLVELGDSRGQQKIAPMNNPTPVKSQLLSISS